MVLPFLLAAQAPALRAACPPASGPALLVDVAGLKNRQGHVRVRIFGGSTATYFDKRHWLGRIEVPTPAAGAVRFCMPVPRPGVYAVDVRHDVNGNGDTDRSDGGGASGNPRTSLFDVLFSRKPNPAKVQVRVGEGTTRISITMLYLKGTTFRPWQGMESM